MSILQVDNLSGLSGTDITIEIGKAITGAVSQFKITGGTAGQVIQTNGSGGLSFTTSGGLPTQTGNTGKYLTTDGTNVSWEVVDHTHSHSAELPSQTGQAGEYLQTDGTTATWEPVATDPAMGGDLTGTASNAQIVAGSIGTTELANNSVTSDKIGVDVIVAEDIAANAITVAELQDDAVTTAKIATDAVTANEIADNNVTLDKLADGTQGDTLYYGASGAPTLLPKPGTPAGDLLTFATGDSAPSWAAAAGVSGRILQIVQDTRTSVTSTTSSSFQGNGLLVGITPIADDSKILVMGVANIGVDSGQQAFGRIARIINTPYSNTVLFLGDASGSHAQGLGTTGSGTSSYGAKSFSWCYLDETNTQTGYSEYFFEYSKQGGTIIYMNRDYMDWGIRGASSIIAMEIGA
jgi:hypothetical protein